MKQFVLFLCGILLSANISAKVPSPNIVLIIADDLGYEDVGFTGGTEIKTPHLDKLAASGARLDQFYVQPLCSPTRAALLTGRYPMRYGLQLGVLRPWEQRGLPLNERLLPESLKEVGYRTAIIGKWHLGHNDPRYLPLKRGFDHQYGHYNGQIEYFEHTRMEGFDWHRNDKELREEGYSTHLIAQESVRYIQGSSKEKPFFLYIPFNAVHSPFQVPENYMKPYEHLKGQRRAYAGMLAAMDEAIGQIYSALEKKGLLDNTLIIFSSDNGGPDPGRITDNGALRSGKGSVYEGGVRVCAFATWKGRIKAGTKISTPLHAVDWYPTLLKLTGASPGHKKPLDGVDIWPVLASKKSLEERAILLNATPSGGALRLGDWKLVTKTSTDSESEVLPKKKRQKESGEKSEDVAKGELYNLSKDRSEKENVASKNPEKLEELRKHYERFAQAAVPPSNQTEPTQLKAPRVWGQADAP